VITSSISANPAVRSRGPSSVTSTSAS